MAHSDICCGLYRGRFFMKDLSNVNNPLLPVGNAEATITQELTEIEQPSYETLGGTNCKVAYPSSVNLDLTLHCISPENLAMAFLGTSAQLIGDEITDEEHAVNGIHELIPFEHVPDKNYPIVVTDPSGLATYVQDEDYVLTNGGIQIIDDSTILVDGSIIKVSYIHGANYVVDAQTAAQKEFLVVLDGVNVGEAGERAVVLKAWKVKFNPTESFALISGEEFASLALSGEIVKDSTKSTGSQYFKVEWGVEANGVY